MAKENDDTKPEGTESDESDDDDDAAAQALLAKTRGKGATGKDDDDEEAELEAEVEAGVSDSVSRTELLKAIKRRQAATAKARELQTELDNLRRQNETDSEKAVREAEERVQKSLVGKYKPALVKTGAEAALLAAAPRNGKAGIPRLIKLMDMEAIDVTDDLELEGVEEEVARLQEEYPELFGETRAPSDDGDEKPPAKRRTTTTTSRSQDGAGKKPAPKKMSASEIILHKMRGDDI